MAKRREIRNSTAEFLIFQVEGKEQGVEVTCIQHIITIEERSIICVFLAQRFFWGGVDSLLQITTLHFKHN